MPRRATIIGLCLLSALLHAPRVPAARQVSPEQVFAAAAPGMVRIITSCKGELGQGSGFLVGPRTIVTALHVLKPPGATGCTASTVKQEGTESAAVVDEVDAYQSYDLAVAHLSAPITGFYFGIAPTQPGVGTGVLALGYSLGNPLSFNQGSVIKYESVGPLSYVGLDLLGGEGSSGGPILNLDGQVIGLTQVGLQNGAVGIILSVDLGKLMPRGKALCQGVAKLSPTTLCGTVAPSALTSGSASGKTTTQPALATAAPPTLVVGSITAREYNAHTIGDKANHIPSPSIQSGDSVEVPAWNGYLRLALIANQDPYGRLYQSTYVRCWSVVSFRTAATAGASVQTFSATTGPLGFYTKGSSWVNVAVPTCANAAAAARGQLTSTNVVALASVLHETFNRQGINDEGELACLGAIGVWEAVNRHVGAAPANRAWALLLDWYSSHLESADLDGFDGCVARFNTDWNG